jgi:transglutaminase/protease-like cytokinesis protein 3
MRCSTFTVGCGARTKYMKLYRRQAGARIANVGARGAARPQNRRNADKAEVFEIALARVSKQVDVVARRTAARLKSERLAAVRAASKAPATTSDGKRAASRRRTAATEAGSSGRRRAAAKTTGGLKRDASSRAAGARRQAARDSR